MVEHGDEARCSTHVTLNFELWTLTFTQNCSKSEEGEYVYLRINFFHPGRSAEVFPLVRWVTLSDSSSMSLSNLPALWAGLMELSSQIPRQPSWRKCKLTFQVHFGLPPYLFHFCTLFLLCFLHRSFRAGSKHGTGAGSGLVHVFNLIKDVQKRFKTREQEKKEMEVGGSDTHTILASFPGLSRVFRTRHPY